MGVYPMSALHSGYRELANVSSKPESGQEDALIYFPLETSIHRSGSGSARRRSGVNLGRHKATVRLERFFRVMSISNDFDAPLDHLERKGCTSGENP